MLNICIFSEKTLDEDLFCLYQVPGKVVIQQVNLESESINLEIFTICAVCVFAKWLSEIFQEKKSILWHLIDFLFTLRKCCHQKQLCSLKVFCDTVAEMTKENLGIICSEFSTKTLENWGKQFLALFQIFFEEQNIVIKGFKVSNLYCESLVSVGKIE